MLKELNICIKANWENEAEPDVWHFILTVPKEVDECAVSEILKKEHDFLVNEDTEEIYEINGRSPVTLLDYVCDKYNWSWRDLEFDIEINLNYC